jgi:hypothetical protein
VEDFCSSEEIVAIGLKPMKESFFSHPRPKGRGNTPCFENQNNSFIGIRQSNIRSCYKQKKLLRNGTAFNNTVSKIARFYPAIITRS